MRYFCATFLPTGIILMYTSCMNYFANVQGMKLRKTILNIDLFDDLYDPAVLFCRYFGHKN